MKAVLINWDALYRRGTTGRKGSFRPDALDLLSNLIARTPVYIYIERDDKDPRTKAWMKMKGKNIDAIRDHIIWITKPAKELANDDTDPSVPETLEPPVTAAIISEEDLHHYDKSPHYDSLEDVIKAVKKELNLKSDDDVSVVQDRNNILFKPQPTPVGSRVKKVTIVEEPVHIDSEDAPLLGGTKPKSKAKRAGYGALIAGLVVLGLYVIAIAVVVGIVFLAPVTAPAAVAIALAVDVTLKALGLGGLIGSAAGALAAFTGLGAGIGALTSRRSASKKLVEKNETEIKQINNTDNVVNGALKSRPPQRRAPSPPSAKTEGTKKIVALDDWEIGKVATPSEDREEKTIRRANSFSR